jgi:hypothetical protein
VVTGERPLLLGVLIFAVLHGLLYVVAIPPWDLFDEEQHFSYILTMREELRIPRLDDLIQPEIIASAEETDRWSAFRIGRPTSLEPTEMGLEGLSYEGYQPPLYYAVSAGANPLGFGGTLTQLYLARALGAVLLAGVAWVTWQLARLWFPGAGPLAWAGAALLAVGIPSMAGAAGRVNNDLLVALLLSGTLLAVVQFLRRPTARWALVLGLVAAAAVLTKTTGLLALLLAGAVTIPLVRRHGSGLASVALALGPGVAIVSLLALFTRWRYGVWNGSDAFLVLITPFEPLGPREFLTQLWFNAWSSYWGAYDGGWWRIAAGLLLALAVAAGLLSLWKRRSAYMPLMLTGLLVAGLLAGLWSADQSGLAHPHGRMLLPAFPPVAALVAGGLTQRFGTVALALAVAAELGMSGAYFVGWFYPFFHGGVS